MTRRGLVIDDGKLRLEYLRTAADTDGDLHEMLARYAPGSPWPPAHLHPAQDERFVVQEGRLQFRLDGELRTVGAGEELTIPRGVVHQARNSSDEPAVAVWQTRPAGRTGEFLAAIDAARARKNPLQMAVTVQEFSDVFCLAVPPRPVTSAAVRGLATAARLTKGGRTPA